MDVSDKDSLYQSYASVAQKLSILGSDNNLADMKQIIERCVIEISTRHCLLIFDNTKDTTLPPSRSFTTGATDLTDCLPRSKLCSVIFTTTNSNTAQALASQNVIALQELTPDTALKMLQTRLARPLANTEQQEAKHLLRKLLYLPLAIAQAAACMNTSGTTVQKYGTQLDEQEELALECSSDSSEGMLRGSSVADPAAATLFFSISYVRYNNALAADYLFLAACVDRKTFRSSF
jgi:hypothetical protein